MTAMETTSQPTTPTDRQTFIIGDVHGHWDRLEALLDKAGIEEGHKVIQLGDLGHYGMTQTAVNDFKTWRLAQDHIDVFLWGNHDYAVFNTAHLFGGFEQPFYETYDLMKLMMKQRRLRMAAEAHGFVLTHAGLAKAFKGQNVDPALKEDPKAFVHWVNNCEHEQSPPGAYIGLRDAISGYRGGGATAGGILWRDAREKLYPAFRQVFGHTAKDNKIRRYQGDHGYSYCIDIGNATNGRLAGIWLPSEEIIQIQTKPA